MTDPRTEPPGLAATLPPPPDNGRDGHATRVRAILPDRDRVLLLARRQALLIELGALETYLGLERSVIPKHLRDHDDCRDGRS